MLGRLVAIVVVKVCAISADDLGDVPTDNQRGRLVDADSQQLRKCFHDAGHVGKTFALGKVLVDGTPDEIRNSSNPIVEQFLTGKADGPFSEKGIHDDFALSILGMELES